MIRRKGRDNKDRGICKRYEYVGETSTLVSSKNSAERQNQTSSQTGSNKSSNPRMNCQEREQTTAIDKYWERSKEQRV